MSHSTTRLRIHLIVLGLYSILALLLTWPLATQISTAVPGVPQWAFDESTFLWNTWYLKHALIDQLRSPLHSELIWYPVGIDLILYTYNFFHALLALPLTLAANLPFGNNVALLLSSILSGYGTFLLALYLLGSQAQQDSSDWLRCRVNAQWAAFVAGLLFAFASNRAIYAMLGHYDMVTTQWIPFYALMLLRSLDVGLSPHRRYKAAALAGFFLALNGLAEMITALFLGIFTVIVLLVTLAKHWRMQKKASSGAEQGNRSVPLQLGSIMRSLALIGSVTLLIWSPVLIPILTQFLANDFSLQGWGEAIPLSVDLLGWFTPTVLHPLLGSDVVDELRRVQLRALEMGVTGFRDVNTAFLGWISLALAILGAAVYRRRLSIWIWTTLVFGVFTLGPFLQINGQYRFDLDGVESTFPLPFALLHYLPIIKANRAPNRNSVILMLGLSVLVSFAIYWLLGKLDHSRSGRSQDTQTPWYAEPKWWIAGSLCGLIILEHLALPLPLSDARIPDVYAQIATDTRPVSVMHVPLGWRNSFGVYGPERTQLQYYQTAHAKPMLGGNISRAPDFKMEYFKRLPFFRALTDIQFGRDVTPDALAAAQEQADELMYLYNTEYVVLMPPIPQRFPYVDHWQEAWDFVKVTLPLETTPFWAEDGIEAYRIVQPEGSDRFMLDLGAEHTYPYRGEGWDAAETDTTYGESAIWVVDTASRLFVPLRRVDPDAHYRVSIQVHPFAFPGSSTQTVALQVNGVDLEEIPLTSGWQPINWEVPGSVLVDGLNRLHLTWAYTASPRDVLAGDRAIGNTGVELPIDADLKAFVDGAFIALFDEEGQQIDGSAGRQGVNVTVLDPYSGEIQEKSGFDTTANQYESQALADHLAQLEAGVPVLVASSGNATAFLTDQAVEELRRIGAGIDLDSLAGNYFAIAGVKGAAPNSAAVVIDPTEAFLSLSLDRDQRPLAAAVDWVAVEKVP